MSDLKDAWHTGPLALFDLETTGVDPHRDRIVTAAVIDITPGHEKVQHDWLLNPSIPIPDAATRIHGITTEKARADGSDPATAVDEIADRLMQATTAGACIVGHNVTYDLTMLWCELLRHGRDKAAEQLHDVTPVVDTFVLDKRCDRYRKGSRRLVDVARHYNVELTEQDAHGAAADALAAGRIAWQLAQQYPELLQVRPAKIHELQVGWKREQSESFGAYLTRHGKTDDVSREWPIQSPPPGWTPEQLPTTREQVA